MLAFSTSSKAQNKTELPEAITRNIIQDKKGNIWLASAKGIFKYDGKALTHITDKVSSARFSSVLEDRKGNFWFGSAGSGVYNYDGKSFKKYTIEQGLGSNEVASIYEDKTGNIWFGTESGASRYDGNTFLNFKLKQGLADDTGGGDSTNVSDQENKVWMHNDIHTIMEDKTGKLWFGTKAATYTYDGKTFTLFNDSKTFTNVRAIMQDKKGNIWLGGNYGLWCYNGRTFTPFSQNAIAYIYQDKKGNIWTTSENQKDREWILSRYDESSLADKKPMVTEFKSLYKGYKGMLYGILEANDGSIWVGGGNGVYRYDGKTLTEFKK
jgi:ligand-binding sensor domain-containing protein